MWVVGSVGRLSIDSWLWTTTDANRGSRCGYEQAWLSRSSSRTFNQKACGLRVFGRRLLLRVRTGISWRLILSRLRTGLFRSSKVNNHASPDASPTKSDHASALHFASVSSSFHDHSCSSELPRLLGKFNLSYHGGASRRTSLKSAIEKSIELEPRSKHNTPTKNVPPQSHVGASIAACSPQVSSTNQASHCGLESLMMPFFTSPTSFRLNNPRVPFQSRDVPSMSFMSLSQTTMAAKPPPHSSHPDFLHLVLLVFEAVLEVVCVSLPGYIVARQGMFSAEMQKFAANLNVMLFTPCLSESDHIWTRAGWICSCQCSIQQTGVPTECRQAGRSCSHPRHIRDADACIVACSSRSVKVHRLQEKTTKLCHCNGRKSSVYRQQSRMS